MLQSADTPVFRESGSTGAFSFTFSESEFWDGTVVSVSLPHFRLIGHAVCDRSVVGVFSVWVSDGWPGRVEMSAYI